VIAADEAGTGGWAGSDIDELVEIADAGPAAVTLADAG
jgi:hypothetical protein